MSVNGVNCKSTRDVEFIKRPRSRNCAFSLSLLRSLLRSYQKLEKNLELGSILLESRISRPKMADQPTRPPRPPPPASGARGRGRGRAAASAGPPSPQVRPGITPESALVEKTQSLQITQETKEMSTQETKEMSSGTPEDAATTKASSTSPAGAAAKKVCNKKFL